MAGLEAIYWVDAEQESFFIRTLTAIGWCVRGIQVKPVTASSMANTEIASASCWAAPQLPSKRIAQQLPICP